MMSLHHSLNCIAIINYRIPIPAKHVNYFIKEWYIERVLKINSCHIK
ncbi:hypothetical protein LGKMAHEF_01617 [Aeromonas salmonicida]